MNSSYSNLAIWMYVPPMMIVVSIWIVALGYPHGHDFDPAIDELVNHVDLSMHYPDSSYHDALVFQFHHRLDLTLAVSHVDFHHHPMASTIHQMLLLVAVNVADVVVLDWHVNHVD